MGIKLDMIQTLTVAVCAYYLGSWLKKKISIFQKFCIPAPVIGGLIFAIVNLIFSQTGVGQVQLDTTLQSPCMLIFFTSIGLTASWKLIKKGGLRVVIFFLASFALIILQDLVGIGITKILDTNPLLGLIAGSVTMTGGHGTGATWAVVFEEQFGMTSANTITMAAATFGLIGGSLIGGPVGRKLIVKNNLKPAEVDLKRSNEDLTEDVLAATSERFKINSKTMFDTLAIICICMGIGTIIEKSFKAIGITMPIYIGAMIIGAIIANIGEKTGKFQINLDCNDILGNSALNIFLSMALISLKLWELKAVAGPLLIILFTQVIMMALYAMFVTFRVLGRDYDAAVISAGHCGFGLGATPNAMANMDSVTSTFGPSPTAYLVLPIVGAFLVDFANSLTITIFTNFI